MALEIQVSQLDPKAENGQDQRFRKERLRIGRCRDNDVALESSKLSRYHAEVFVAEGKLKVRDLGSRNGTWVNGARIAAETPLAEKDVLGFGDGGPTLKVSLVEAAPSARADADHETTFIQPVPKKAKVKGVPALAVKPAAAPAPAKPEAAPAAAKQEASPVIKVVPRPEAAPAAAKPAPPAPAPALAAAAPAAAAQAAAAGPLLLDDGGLPVDALGKAGVGHSTLMLALSALQAQQRSKTQKVIALVTAAVAAVVLLVVTSIIVISRSSAQEGDRYREDLARLEDRLRTGDERVAELEGEIKERDDAVEQVKKQQGLSDADRATLLARTESQLDGLRAELKKTQEARGTTPEVWADLVERYKESVFLCVSRSRDGAGFGTAFAVREDGLLATNAHVVKMMREDAETLVVQNGTGRVFGVAQRIANPDFTGVNSPDVGLLKITTNGAVLTPFTLADDEALKKLRIGTQLGTLGYPGELASTYFQGFDSKNKRFKSAVATFKDGWIGQITNYQGEVAEFRGNTRIQHSASLTGGTSGSPMFTADGKVVALNNSSLDISIPRNGQKITTKSAAQIGYAIRVDELRRFIERTGL
jgi:S1-C subfamily serine protease